MGHTGGFSHRVPEAGRATWWYRTVHCSAIPSLAPTTTRKQGDRQARLSLQAGDLRVVYGSRIIRSDCHSGSLILLLARCEKRPPRPVMQAIVCPLHIKPNKQRASLEPAQLVQKDQACFSITRSDRTTPARAGFWLLARLSCSAALATLGSRRHLSAVLRWGRYLSFDLLRPCGHCASSPCRAMLIA